MNRPPLKIGDQVQVTIEGQAEPVTGEVLTYRIAGERQIANVRTPNGDRVMVFYLGDGNKSAVIVPPVDATAARAIAMAVLAGEDRRMPITSSAAMLAAAVINLTGGMAVAGAQ